MEKIECAAIKHKGKVYSMPRPYRHCDIVNFICEELNTNFVGSKGQGFITSTGKFVDRKEAEKIARESLQINKMIGSVLTSEDLW